jgi:hypothetical protein
MMSTSCNQNCHCTTRWRACGLFTLTYLRDTVLFVIARRWDGRSRGVQGRFQMNKDTTILSSLWAGWQALEVYVEGFSLRETISLEDWAVLGRTAWTTTHTQHSQWAADAALRLSAIRLTRQTYNSTHGRTYFILIKCDARLIHNKDFLASLRSALSLPWICAHGHEELLLLIQVEPSLRWAKTFVINDHNITVNTSGICSILP